MHLPILPLFAGTKCSLGRFESLGMDRFNGNVFEEVPDLTGLDIIRENLRQDLVRVLAAKGTLIISKFDDNHRRVGVTYSWRTIQRLQYGTLGFLLRGVAWIWGLTDAL